MKKFSTSVLVAVCLQSAVFAQSSPEIVPALPDASVLSSPFCDEDYRAFSRPGKVFYPQTWFHYVDGNVDKEGITKDLEAIAAAGISGIQFFHGGNFGGDWPGVKDHIYCLTEKWDDLVAHTAREAARLGLRFTMQNCPGWAMSGGPWITQEIAMRHLAYSRADVTSGKVDIRLERPKDSQSNDPDYKDIAVLAFPTPSGERNAFEYDVIEPGKTVRYAPGSQSFKASFDTPHTIRSLVFSSIDGMNHHMSPEPGIHVTVEAVVEGGERIKVLDAGMPASNWQDNRTMTFALDEVSASVYEIRLDNIYDMNISRMRLTSAARKNNWEAEAGWTLRSIVRESASPHQSSDAYICYDDIIDISEYMSADGHLVWTAPAGNWTVLRIGHVNTGMKNAPAPPEAVGWECDKLSFAGADAHYPGYIGRLADGPVKGMLGSMLMDSWECRTQTWTKDMENEFASFNGYGLRKWIPAVFGFVIGDQQTSGRFLNDWRATINYLYVNKFYGRMAEHAHRDGLNIAYETSSGDIFTGDPLEYYKYADIPMCEFWQSTDSTFLGSFNFKPIRPTVSAARMYGKPRVDAESLTSSELTWDEHLDILKETVNQNSAQGVTHYVFHTYTHNPAADLYVPGTSFGSNIGTPFLRNQTWWQYMPEFTTYLARSSYMFERGHSVSDVLWFIGDEIEQKPDQYAAFPEGYKYDYVNHDALMNRLSVRDGKIVTPEGLEYEVLWIPVTYNLRPDTVNKLLELVNVGATLVADAPLGNASLTENGAVSFKNKVEALWGCGTGLHRVGRGQVISGTGLQDALHLLGIAPDLVQRHTPVSKVADDGIYVRDGGKAQWMHRAADGADWYFITSPRGAGFNGTVDVRATGVAQIWDAVDGSVRPANVIESAMGRTSVALDLPRGGACFLVLRHDIDEVEAPVEQTLKLEQSIALNEWTVHFPQGWGAPESVRVRDLKPWKDMGLGEEGSAFSGTADYRTTVILGNIERGESFVLNLGNVDMVAAVKVNGKEFRTLWCEPYSVDITSALQTGTNEISINVTSTWYNRLAYDAGLEEASRKTWTMFGPAEGAELRESGLLGPVALLKFRSEIGGLSFPYPDIPDEIKDPGKQILWLAGHFWDDVDDIAQIKSSSLEQAVVDFLTLLEELPDKKIGAPIRRFLRSVSDVGIIMPLVEKYLYDIDSPMRDDELYASIVSKLSVVGSKELFRQITANRPGTRAPDFTMSSIDGKTLRLYDSLGAKQQTLLFFYDDSCDHCLEVISDIKASAQLAYLSALGALKLVCINISDKALPVPFPVYCSDYILSDENFFREGKYFFRSMPSFFLVNAEGDILLKETTLDAALNYCAGTSNIKLY